MESSRCQKFCSRTFWTKNDSIPVSMCVCVCAPQKVIRKKKGLHNTNNRILVYIERVCEHERTRTLYIRKSSECLKVMCIINYSGMKDT